MLSGRIILHTRAEDPADPLPARVAALGGVLRAMPCIRIEPSPEPERLYAIAAELSPADLIAAGSPNALLPLAEALAARGAVFTGKLACVGKKTAEAVRARPELRARFTGPLLVPERYRAEAMAQLILQNPPQPGGQVIYPRAPEGRTVLIERLRAAGLSVQPVLSYAIGCVPAQPEDRARLEGVDAALFLSGRTLECFLQRVGPAWGKAWLSARTLAVIGPVAKEKAEALGLRVDLCPDRATQEDLLQELGRSFA